MTLRFNNQGAMSSEFERRANGLMTKKMEVVERVLREEGRRGAEEMQRIIGNEGVHNRVADNSGRYESGDMLRAVKYDVKRTKRSVVLRVGWLPGNRKKYFGWQNDGTYDKGRTKGILPLLAAQRVHDETRDRIAYRLRRR